MKMKPFAVVACATLILGAAPAWAHHAFAAEFDAKRPVHLVGDVYKRQTLLSVPTQAMRNGDMSVYLNPSNGGSANALTGYPGNIIPQTQLNSFAQSFSNLIYPLPNYGPPGSIANNYLATYEIPINSAQGDVRLDQSISPKHLVYVRYTYKNRRITGEQLDPSGNPSTPLLGEVSTPQIYSALAASYNWIVSPSMVNELRGGFSLVHRDVSFGITAQQAATTLGLTNLPGIPPGDDVPSLSITCLLYTSRCV